MTSFVVTRGGPALVEQGAFGTLAVVLIGVFFVGLILGARRFFYAVHPYVWPTLLSLVPATIAALEYRPDPPASYYVAVLVTAVIALVWGARTVRLGRRHTWFLTVSHHGELGLLATAVGGGIAILVPAYAREGLVSSIVCLVVLALVEDRTTRRAFARVTEGLDGAKRVGTAMTHEIDAMKDSRTPRELFVGRQNGHRIAIALLGNWFHRSVRIDVQLLHWPSNALVSTRTGGDVSDDQDAHARRFPRTGDVTFDALLRIEGPDEAWRPVLSSRVRSLLVALLHDLQAKLDPVTQLISTEIPSANVGRQLAPTLQNAIALAESLPSSPEDPRQQVFAAARQEQDAVVRLSHYRWLVEAGWNVPTVFRAAADDPDPAIAAWGRMQVPAGQGTFR